MYLLINTSSSNVKILKKNGRQGQGNRHGNMEGNGDGLRGVADIE